MNANTAIHGAMWGFVDGKTMTFCNRVAAYIPEETRIPCTLLHHQSVSRQDLETRSTELDPIDCGKCLENMG